MVNNIINIIINGDIDVATDYCDSYSETLQLDFYGLFHGIRECINDSCVGTNDRMDLFHNSTYSPRSWSGYCKQSMSGRGEYE